MKIQIHSLLLRQFQDLHFPAVTLTDIIPRRPYKRRYIIYTQCMYSYIYPRLHIAKSIGKCRKWPEPDTPANIRLCNLPCPYLTISTTHTHNKYYLHTYLFIHILLTASHTQHYTALQQNELFPPNLFLLQCTRVLSVYHRRVESGENLISFYLETHCWRLGALEMENGGPRSITVSIELSSRNSSRLVDNSFEKYRIHLVNWTSKKS